MDTSFIELPTMINVDPIKYYKTTRDVCYWTNDRNCSNEILSLFIEKAKEYKLGFFNFLKTGFCLNFTEDQALAVLMYNNFDIVKSEYDIQIYRPIKGLAKMDVKQVVKIISEGIVKTVKSREHRDFDDILLMFPGYTIGDVLGTYSKHRFLIKKETYKAKKCVKKSISKPYVSNGGLKDVESLSWNESCSDTQFQLIYHKHYGIIGNSCHLQDFISRDLSDMKNYNGNGVHNDSEADGILSLLRKMNRKRTKPGSMFERSQLSNILSSVALERRSRSVNTTPVKQKIELKSMSGHLTRKPSPMLESFLDNTDSINELSLEDKLYEYIKSDNSFQPTEDDSDDEDGEILHTLKILSEQHETALDGFKNYLPDPSVFQQLSHSWNNMDFAILLLGLSEFGTNFQKISDSIFTKSEAMVASFYANRCAEFNLEDIVSQPFRTSDLEPCCTDLGNDEIIPPPKIKLEETEPETLSVCHTTSNACTDRSLKGSKSKKVKSKSSTKSDMHSTTNSLPDVELPVTMNLRSRLETNRFMKSLIDEELKSKNMKYNSRRNVKRKNNCKVSNEIKAQKQMKKD